MKLISVLLLFFLLTAVLASVSNISIGQTGNFAKISSKGGLYVSITILMIILIDEFGLLNLPYRFKGKRKKRSFISHHLIQDRNSILRMISEIDHHHCLLRYLCELEALRLEAEKSSSALDPDLEPDWILLKVAKKTMHPAELMRKDPASPALPFEVAVFTGSEGLDSCAATFQTCSYNITTMKGFLYDAGFSNNIFM